MNMLSNEQFSTFLDVACQIMLHCCPKQELPIEKIFSPVRFVLPQGYDYIVSNEIRIAGLSGGPISDLDDLRDKCKSAVSSSERSSNGEQRVRPKSSSSVAMASGRARSGKGVKFVEPQTPAKKKTTLNGRHRQQRTTLEEEELDDEGREWTRQQNNRDRPSPCPRQWKIE